MGFSLLRIFTALLLLLLSGLGLAAQFPTINNRNTLIIPIEDGAVDTAIRNAALDRAQVSFDVAAYAQGFDAEVGAQFVKGFAEAANRGIKGRILYDGLVSRYQDLGGKAAKLLADAGIDVMSICPIKKMFCGISPTDFFHGKIMIIDAGTPNETIIIGGRNIDKFSKIWHDYAIVIRPVDPSQPYLGTQIKELFEEYWKTAQKIQKVSNPGKPSMKDINRLTALPNKPEQTLSPQGVAAFKEIDGLLVKPASELTSDPRVFRPEAVRTYSNDFMEQALSKKHGKSMESRQLTMKSDIASGIADAIRHAKRVTISSMLPMFSPEINDALAGVVERGGEVHLFTNGKEAQAPTKGYGWDFMLPQLDRLTRLPGAKDRVKIYGFQPGAMLPDGNGHPLDFAHLKKVIIELEDGTIFTYDGSDNVNQQGHTKNEELMVEINSREYGEYSLNKMARDAETMYREIPHSEIQRDAAKKVGFVKRCILNYMSHLF